MKRLLAVIFILSALQAAPCFGDPPAPFTPPIGWSSSSANPALISLEDRDQIFFGAAGFLAGESIRGGFGYRFPVGGTMGIGLKMLFLSYNERGFQGPAANETDPLTPAGSDGLREDGIVIDWGWKIGQSVSIGLGIGAFGYPNTNRRTFALGMYGGYALSANGGISLFAADRSLVFDTRIGLYGFPVLTDTSTSSVFLENALSVTIDRHTAILYIKQLNEANFDEFSYTGSLFPILELSASAWWSGRIGLEGLMNYDGAGWYFGYGILAGTSFRINDAGLRFDLNLTLVSRPTSQGIYTDAQYIDLVISFSVVKEGIAVSRKRP